jgi:ApaG protein
MTARRPTPQTYQATTGALTVRVRPEYLQDQSDEDERRWVFAYHIDIENHGPETVQLLARHWIITDGVGRVEEVKGLGVVGKQPTLRPGERFSYSSGCPLSTPSGMMAGTYRMVSDRGYQFDIVIPAFSLDIPGDRRVMN